VRGLRIGVSYRIVFALGLTAAVATVVTVLLQARTLSSDLALAAQDRIDQSAGAALVLIEQHKLSVLERNRAIARTPEFRANLATAHSPTLAEAARSLRERGTGIRAVAFSDAQGKRVASNGDRELVLALLDRSGGRPVPRCATNHLAGECAGVAGPGQTFLLVYQGELMVGAAISLFTGGEFVGRLMTGEAISEDLLSQWTVLAGAELDVRGEGSATDPFERVALAVGGIELRVRGSFEAEREALTNLYQSSLAAGAAAFAFALALAVPLSRGLIDPIRTIERAAHRIRAGDWSTRLHSERPDELGDVARAFDTMLDHVEATQASLRRAQRIGQLGGWSHVPGSPDVEVSDQLGRTLVLDVSSGSVPIAALIDRVVPSDRFDLLAALGCCAEEGRAFSLDHLVVLPDGSERVVHTQAERITSPDGSQRVEGTIQDITQRKQVEDEVRRLAYEDDLTGLGNRRCFGEALRRAIELGRQQLAPLAVLFLDLDDFKIINDTLGHSVGDRLLRTVADRILAVVSDPPGAASTAGASVHRLGGDEFAVVLPRIVEADQPLDCARRILDRLREVVELDGYEVNVTASIGIARWPDEGEDPETLAQGCDTAMYHAKRQGRGLYRVYDASMRESVERRLQLESRLQGAIERGDLHLHYQPKVELATGRVAGLEALLRWNDDELGVIGPDEFIPLAEGTGQILELGPWVLREAARQSAAWSRDGVTEVPIAVNVSSSQLDAGALVAAVREVLAETGIEPERLELEVTESALLRDELPAIELLHEAKALGLGLALDDFGTGYSSLSYLRQLPIDTVKIDRSFLENITADPAAHALLGSILSMIHILGLKVVAEGVESEHQRDLLQEMGCDQIQGYWYSAPVPPDQVALAIRQCEAPGKRRAR